MRIPLILGIALAASGFAAESRLEVPVPVPAPPPVQIEIPPLRASPTKLVHPPAATTWMDSPPIPVVEILGLIDLFGSVDRFRTAVSADRITVTRLKPRDMFALAPADYIEGEPVILSPIEADKLQRTLVLDSSYVWTAEETCDCTPQYEYRVRFFAGDAAVTCDISLSEKTLRVIDGAQEIAAAPFSPRSQAILTLLADKRTKG